MVSEYRHACIIIDDPLLRENYGFLNYRKLLDLMDRHNFFTTIAFIPFNYGRTDRKIAALFQERPDRFSICVHGCDHTGGEFAITNADCLDRKVQLATARMLEHQRRTGVPFDRIMVFPQGRFSNAAMLALKKNGYLGAVNTEAAPVDGPLTSNFPFFLRYKPEEALKCDCEPLFIVIHHEYFKDGYNRLTDFIDAVNAQQKTIKWDSVGSIIDNHLQTQEGKKPETTTLKNDIENIDLTGVAYYGYKENLKIRMRRYASEFRDNYIDKNNSLSNFAKKIKSFLKTE